MPSACLIDNSTLLTKQCRQKLLDKVATLVDENLTGRSDMCQQFADLLHRALSYLGLPSNPVVGTAIYFSSNGQEIFRWSHIWVRIGKEVVDGNVDSLIENPVVPHGVQIKPYWGPIADTPRDRRIRASNGSVLPDDEDVVKIWWPELKEWLDMELKKILNGCMA